ncbi:carboxylate-amine ligase [Lentzea tibetensis]|uniref:carboxylate-amine ligase n=1 Tax=Lentzea tibetensis TaxID=2591470 RepID=UPI001C995F22|nr:YbdK family carboxylate-amine ligase [Lentzea tibetensis]
MEEEFLLIDPASGRTAARADAVLSVLENTQLTRFHAELAATQVEAATGPCTELAELRVALCDARERVRAAARQHGLRVVSAGLPERGAEQPVGGRGKRFREILIRYAGVVADYEACACQVHIGVPDRKTGVAVLNHLRPWLPTLLALSASSPHRGYASWRMVLQSRFPGSGVPPWFSSADDYDAHIRRMVECGTLVDESMTFWLARLSRRWPTVEFRAADAVPDVEMAVLQAALSRALVRTAITDIAAGREAPRVRDDVCAAAIWTAARHGLDGPAVHVQHECQVPATKLVNALVEHVAAALEETGDTDTLEKLP